MFHIFEQLTRLEYTWVKKSCPIDIPLGDNSSVLKVCVYPLSGNGQHPLSRVYCL